jgi:DNA polymerase III delta prime subunit
LEAVEHNLVGHRAALDMFSRSLDLQRLCSTYIFAGPPGIGKRVAARACARLILCHARVESKACGQCTSCSAFRAEQHPRFSERDFATLKKGSESVVDVVRAFIEEVQRCGRGGEHLIFLIPNIQAYSIQVQNALLKTFEEPPAGVIFLLTSDRPQQLLETITSRAQMLHLSPLSLAELKAVMLKQTAELSLSELVIRMSEGRVDLALRYSSESYLALIQWVDKKLLKPEQDFLTASEQLLLLAQALELPQAEERDKDVSDREKAKEAIGVFERLFFQKCLDCTRKHFVGLQIFNTTVEELLSARRSIENSGYVALSVEHYLQQAMARLSQILRMTKIPESVVEPVESL